MTEPRHGSPPTGRGESEQRQGSVEEVAGRLASRGTAGGAAVEIVTIGNELLLGQTVDANSAWLGQRLAAAGIRVVRRTTVGDDAAAIRDAVGQALERTGAVLCTGGLGPTRDDLTKAAVADLFGRPLRLDDALLGRLRQRFQERGREMPGINRSQAEIPQGAVVFPNPHGTAAGLALADRAGRFTVLLPGVPQEMRALTDGHVLPWLRARWPQLGQPILHRVVRTTGIPESALAEEIEDLVEALPLTIAFLPGTTGVDLRLTSPGMLAAAEAERAFDAAESALRERLGAHVYGRDDQDLADATARSLRKRSLTLALAESCTGGLIAKRLTDRPGASAFLHGAIVAYANEAKAALLGVNRSTLETYGAVSGEASREMAEGARRMFDADTAVAVTGIAGPDGGTPEKPVGTVWISAAVGPRFETRRFRFGGDREEIRECAAQATLALLWTMLGPEGP